MCGLGVEEWLTANRKRLFLHLVTLENMAKMPVPPPPPRFVKMSVVEEEVYHNGGVH